MQFTVQYPLTISGYSSDFLDASSMVRFARAAEEAGFAAIAVTEHPVPSEKWLAAGGHDSLDVTTALAVCAAVTSRISLMPYAMVLPYRNPFLAAKAIATLDVLSGGRVVLAAACGYLRSEFLALGVEFDERNELFDEAVEVMRGIWSGRDYRYDGRHFRALGQSALPQPLRDGDVPIWIAGNSARARARAAEVGQGWAPLLNAHDRARSVRTAPLPTVSAMARAIADLRDRCERIERDPAEIQIQIESIADTRALAYGSPLDEHRDRLGEFEDIGVGWFVVDTPSATVDEAIESLHRYGEEVISQFS